MYGHGEPVEGRHASGHAAEPAPPQCGGERGSEQAEPCQGYWPQQNQRRQASKVVGKAQPDACRARHACKQRGSVRTEGGGQRRSHTLGRIHTLGMAHTLAGESAGRTASVSVSALA